MYVIISIYGRDDDDYIRTIPLRLFRVPNIPNRSHLLYKNVDNGLLRIRAQVGHDRCTWRISDMDEDVMDHFFRGRLFPNVRVPYGQSMIMFILEKLDNTLVHYNASLSNSGLSSRIFQVRFYDKK